MSSISQGLAGERKEVVAGGQQFLGAGGGNREKTINLAHHLSLFGREDAADLTKHLLN
jgi:hypothetical protein